MFNGIIYFKYTGRGYVVDEALSNYIKRINAVTGVWNCLQTIRIEGRFNFVPKAGQFCKRPHKLLVWG